ncbi:hypothetical protein D3C85_1818410 [compost metagenome]
MQLQLAVVDGGAKLSPEHFFAAESLFKPFRIAVYIVPSVLLDLKHRQIGSLDEKFGVLSILRIDTDPDARRTMK